MCRVLGTGDGGMIKNDDTLLGLRSLSIRIRNLSGASIGFRVGVAVDQLKAAWGRAWYGYSSSSVTDTNRYISELLVGILKHYSDDSPFILTNPDAEFGSPEYEYTKAEAQRVYQHIIDCISKASNEDMCREELFGTEVYDDETNFGDDKEFMSRIKKVEALRKVYQHKAFVLLEKYWDQLWW